MKTALPAVVSIALCALASGATAQERPAAVQAREVIFIDVPRFEEEDVDIKIDGLLSEAIWDQVPSYDGMIITQPGTSMVSGSSTRMSS